MKTGIKMKVNQEQSKKVQMIVFANGGDWETTLSNPHAIKQDIKRITYPYLFISSTGYLGCDNDIRVYNSSVRCKEVSADLFIRTNGTCELFESEDNLEEISSSTKQEFKYPMCFESESGFTVQFDHLTSGTIRSLGDFHDKDAKIGDYIVGLYPHTCTEVWTQIEDHKEEDYKETVYKHKDGGLYKILKKLDVDGIQCVKYSPVDSDEIYVRTLDHFNQSFTEYQEKYEYLWMYQVVNSRYDWHLCYRYFEDQKSLSEYFDMANIDAVEFQRLDYTKRVKL
jgi:hypothetical protein